MRSSTHGNTGGTESYCCRPCKGFVDVDVETSACSVDACLAGDQIAHESDHHTDLRGSVDMTSAHGVVADPPMGDIGADHDDDNSASDSDGWESDVSDGEASDVFTDSDGDDANDDVAPDAEVEDDDSAVAIDNNFTVAVGDKFRSYDDLFRTCARAAKDCNFMIHKGALKTWIPKKTGNASRKYAELRYCVLIFLAPIIHSYEMSLGKSRIQLVL